MEAQPGNLVHVVQGGVAHGDTPDKHRIKSRHRGDRAGSTHLKLHGPHPGRRFFRRILEGDGPTRATRQGTQALLQFQPVDLDDGSVDVVTQRTPSRQQRIDVGLSTRNVLHHAGFRIDAQPPRAQRFQHFHLSSRPPCVVHDTDAVAVHRQRPRSGYSRIQLPQAACGTITGIDQRFFTAFPGKDVERLKIPLRHVDLPSNLEQPGHSVGVQQQRHRADRANVGRDVFPGFSIATGRRENQPSRFVAQRDGYPVYFRLTGELERLFGLQSGKAAGQPVVQFLPGGALVQRQHRQLVSDLGKLGKRRATDTLRR